MLELLKFEYKRMLSCKPVYFILAAAVIMPLVAGIGLNFLFYVVGIEDFGELEGYTAANEKFFTWFIISYFYTRLPIFLALFTSLFLGRDFKDGFVRNKVTAGHSRLSIYASAMITQVSFTAALCVIYVFIGTVTMALSPMGANLNNGEMLLRAFVLMLSLIGMTVLFTALSMAINNRALVTVISVVFVMALGLAGSLATSYSYSAKTIDDYIDVCEDKVDEYENDYGYNYYTVPEKEDYINAGWAIGHTLYVTTNAGLEKELMSNLQDAVLSIADDDEIFAYPKKITRMGFSQQLISALFGSGNPPPLDKHDLKKIDGMVVDIDDLMLAYSLKSVIWIAIFAGGGYAIFRKKNLS
ncbi:MAG: ABC transporter permease [Saccharofermentans sp.]|nr:ABC transporter permease [Saccharofermentans sp.]